MTKVGKNVLGKYRKFHASEIAWRRGTSGSLYTLEDFMNQVPNSELMFGSLDFNDYTIQGSFSVGGKGIFVNAPKPSGLYGVVHVTVRVNEPYQIVHTFDNKMYRRSYYRGTWTEWKEF